ncbi:aspartate-semialdehyde dehydrogenase [archaeon SCG-AAA382B04]|nr:aspartate-semialdehyde dehydrogenase [archaeon SCG-AAA382B04]
MVGQRFVKILANHPWFNIKALTASKRSSGKEYKKGVNWVLDTEIPKSIENIEIQKTHPKVDGDLAFSALPSNIADSVEENFAKKGFAVASNASSHRMESDVPLVIPEVNPSHLELIEKQKQNREWSGYVVTNPNCSTIILTLPLKPIQEKMGLSSVKVVTLQAVSGAGYSGVPSMAIIDNAIPYISSEEIKMEKESKKLLGKVDNGELNLPDIDVSAQCNRIPVTDGHMESVWIETEEETSPNEIKKALEGFMGEPQKKDLPSAPKKPIIVKESEDRPQPRLDKDLGDGMSVSVGRIRGSNKEFKLTILGHNTIRGAAGASILNAELMTQKGYLK